jgi:CTP synthase (UTP-ammonia lyase)
MSTSIAVVGDRDTSLLTHRELDAAIARLPTSVQASWVGTDRLGVHERTPSPFMQGVDGVWLAPGTPYRDDDAVYTLLREVRERGIPFLGTCGGFQYALVEFAHNVAGIADAVHAESDPGARDPVVGLLGCSLVGARRTVTAVPSTRLAAYTGTVPFHAFHWCNYGLQQQWIPQLEDAGLVVSANAEDAGVEAVELPSHPFFVATLFQPQVGAANGSPLHPLIGALCAAAARSRSLREECAPPSSSRSA